MQRRTLLLFALFVVTAWFYSGIASEGVGVAAETHQKQMKMLEDVENSLSSNHAPESKEDQG